MRAITEALGEGHGLPQLTARGLVATCTACGGIMGVRDRHCPSCGAAAGDEARDGLPPALEEPTYDDDEIAVHQAADDDQYDGDYEDDDDGYDDPDDDGIEDAEEVETDEHEAVGVGPGANGASASAASNGGSPPPYTPPQPKRRDAIVPRAQRTLRAGRRLARHWIEERRTGGR